MIWGYRQISQRYNGSQWGLCECVCICFTHIIPQWRGVCVWSADLFCHFLLLGFPHAESFCSHTVQSCAMAFVSTTDWRRGELCRGRPAVSSPPAVLLCLLLLPSIPLFTAPSLPSPLQCGLSSLGQWSTNTTRSTPSCSKKPLATLGTTKMSLTPVENTFTLSASCPQAWQVGVHIEGGLTPAETRTQKAHRSKTACCAHYWPQAQQATYRSIFRDIQPEIFLVWNSQLMHLTKQSHHCNFVIIR